MSYRYCLAAVVAILLNSVACKPKKESVNNRTRRSTASDAEFTKNAVDPSSQSKTGKGKSRSNKDALDTADKPLTDKTFFAVYGIGSDLEDVTINGTRGSDEAFDPFSPEEGALSDDFREMLEGYNSLNAAQKSKIGGLFAYDLVEQFEPLPAASDGDGCPDFVFHVAEQVVHFDHVRQVATATQVGLGKESLPAAGRQLDALARLLEEVGDADLPPIAAVNAEPEVDLSDERFREIVGRLKEEVFRGVVFQCVPSRSFRFPCPAPHRVGSTRMRRTCLFPESEDCAHRSLGDSCRFGRAHRTTTRQLHQASS